MVTTAREGVSNGHTLGRAPAIETIRERLWAGAIVAIGLGGLTALLSALAMPRGPVTNVQGLLVVASALGVGLAAGYLTRSRLSMLLTPLAYVAAYELARGGVAGASLEFRFDSAYGIAAFAAGRGFHGLLALLPMAGGASLGVALARRGEAGSGHGWPRRVARAVPRTLMLLLTFGLAVLVALPPTSPPVLGADGRPVPGSIAELVDVELGGARQAISIRAADPTDPVLLYLSGGPGQSDIAFSRALLEPLVADLVVVGWDQRGTGRSYAALDPTSALTLEQAVRDTIELTEYLRERFDEERIYLLGESWGSTLGVLAVRERPDLFHAYIGSGQMVSQRETDRIIWRDLLVHAERVGDWALYDQVLTLGEPPYRDSPWANAFVMSHYATLETPYTPPAASVERGEASGVGPYGILGSEYGVVDKANVIRGLIDMFSLMYPQLQAIDFRRDVSRLEVPVYILDGAHELRGRRALAHEWFEALEAPHKRLVTYADAGHSVVFEVADAFRALMLDEIVPLTYGTRPAS